MANYPAAFAGIKKTKRDGKKHVSILKNNLPLKVTRPLVSLVYGLLLINIFDFCWH